MLNNQTYTVQLNSNDVTTLIKGLSASDHYHKNLPKIHFSYPAELDEILQNNHRIKSILKDALKDTVKVYPKSSVTLCPRPPETSDTALSSTDDVDGGIHSYLEALKHINALVNGANEFAYDNSIINDDDHYELLEIELKIQQLITRDSIIEDAVRSVCSVCFDDIPPCFYSHPVDGSAMPFNLE